MSEQQKRFTVTIYFAPEEIVVTAKNITEAKKKALVRLEKKNPIDLIQTHYQTHRKDILIDEIY